MRELDTLRYEAPPPELTPKAVEAARVAIWRLIRRLQTDPRFAHYCDPLTQTFEDVTEAHALLTGQDVEAFRRRIQSSLRFEAPPPKVDDLLNAASAVLASEYCSIYRRLPPFTDLDAAIARYRSGS